jgi:hypothetical protein
MLQVTFHKKSTLANDNYITPTVADVVELVQSLLIEHGTEEYFEILVQPSDVKYFKGDKHEC